MSEFNIDNMMSLDDAVKQIDSLQGKDLQTILLKLKQLAEILYIGGVKDYSPSLSIDIIVDYIYTTINTLLDANDNDVEHILDDLILKIRDANNDEDTYTNKKNRKDNQMSEATVIIYNPSFDPGHDTSTCVEINGKVAGLAFSVKGIQDILKQNDIIVTADDIIEHAATSGLTIAEDSDEIYTPTQYADALESVYSTNLDETVHKNSNITYKKLIEGYRTLENKKYAEYERFENRTDSELRRLLWDVWINSERPAEFDRDRLNYMTRDEVIEAIKAQETQPVRSEAAVDEIMAEYNGLTVGDIFEHVKKAESEFEDSDTFSEEILLEDDYFGDKTTLVNMEGLPVESSIDAITEEVLTGGLVETRDGSKSISADANGYTVSAEDMGYEEFFEEGEINDAVELFQELAVSESLTTDTFDTELSMASTAAKPGEIVNLDMPTQEEFEEAKMILDQEMKKRQMLNEALAEYTKKIRDELGFTEEDDIRFKQAAEVMLKKVRNFKRGYQKLSEEFNAKVGEMTSGGSFSLPRLRQMLSEKYDIQVAEIKELEKLARTPEWGKEILVIEERDTGKKTPLSTPFILKEETSADKRIEEMQAVSDMLDSIMNTEMEYLQKLDTLETEELDVAASRR